MANEETTNPYDANDPNQQGNWIMWNLVNTGSAQGSSATTPNDEGEAEVGESEQEAGAQGSQDAQDPQAEGGGGGNWYSDYTSQLVSFLQGARRGAPTAHLGELTPEARRKHQSALVGGHVEFDQQFYAVHDKHREFWRADNPIVQVLSKADLVDLGLDVKPEHWQDHVIYHASIAGKPFVNLGKLGASLGSQAAGGKPVAVDQTGLDRLLQGPIDEFMAMLGHNPKGRQPGQHLKAAFGDVARYYGDNPARLAELPGEVALGLVTGFVGGKLVTKAVPLAYGKLATPVADGTEAILWRGVSTKHGRQIVGVVTGPEMAPKIQIGRQTIDVGAFDPGAGRAVGKNIGGPTQGRFYDEDTLARFVASGRMTAEDADKLRLARESTRQVMQADVPTAPRATDLKFENTGPAMADSLLGSTAKLQKSVLDALHGSTVVQAHVRDSLKRLAGERLLSKDIDAPVRLGVWDRINPGGVPKKVDKAIGLIADDLRQKFPKLDVEVSGVGSPLGTNRAIKVGDRKVYEIVTNKPGKKDAPYTSPETHVDGFRLPGKTHDVTLSGHKTEVTDLKRQFLENTSTTMQLRSGPDGSVLVGPGQGRPKDVVRRYWLARESAQRLREGGQDAAAARLEATLARERALWSGKLDFGSGPPPGLALPAGKAAPRPAGTAGSSPTGTVTSEFVWPSGLPAALKPKSVVPSAAGSRVPSSTPSLTPSRLPSGLPSSLTPRPSATPSALPSSTPSLTPSSLTPRPSGTPSLVPSSAPPGPRKSKTPYRYPGPSYTPPPSGGRPPYEVPTPTTTPPDPPYKGPPPPTNPPWIPDNPTKTPPVVVPPWWAEGRIKDAPNKPKTVTRFLGNTFDAEFRGFVKGRSEVTPWSVKGSRALAGKSPVRRRAKTPSVGAFGTRDVGSDLVGRGRTGRTGRTGRGAKGGRGGAPRGGRGFSLFWA